jgi:hypothetical protein
VPRDTETAYPKTKAREDEAPTTAPAEGGGGETDTGEATGRAGGKAFADYLKSDDFQATVANAADSLLIVNERKGDGDEEVVPPVVDEAGLPNRAQAKAMGNLDYVKWLASSGNDATRGGTPSGIARFMTEQADEAELGKIRDGARMLSKTDYGQKEGSRFAAANLAKVADLADAIGKVKDPYAKHDGPPGLHLPDRENPKPLGFSDILGKSGDEEDYAKLRLKLRNEGPAAAQAMDDAEVQDDSTFGANLRDQVAEFNRGAEWGKAVSEAVPGKLVPKPANIEGGLSKEGAVARHKDPTSDPRYKALLARQRAWTYWYTKRLGDLLRGVGGAAPKVQAPERRAIEGSKQARWDAPQRRVVWHSPDDPVSKALARRLSRRPR